MRVADVKHCRRIRAAKVTDSTLIGQMMIWGLYMGMNSFSINSSMLSSQSRYWHISHSIQFTSHNWKIPCPTILQDLFKYMPS
jgi:hypothetical protein